MYEEWKELYAKGYTLRMIAEKFNTNHHFVKRRLVEMGMEITHLNRIRKPLSDEARKKMSIVAKRRPSPTKGKKATKTTLYKNMAGHLQLDISLDFLMQFADIEKLKFLNKLLTRDRVKEHFDEEKYKKFIEKFYFDEAFNKQFEIFKASGNKYDRPSIDHIIPLARGGDWSLENLQILSWFDNHAKCDMKPDEYEEMKKKYWKTTESNQQGTG